MKCDWMKSDRRQRASRRRGFWLADTLTGLAIVSSIAVVLAAAIGRERAAENKLADSRSANRVAERVLLNLQHHQLPPTLDGDTHFTIRQIDKPPLPNGDAWTAVDATVHGKHATLIGYVTGQRDGGTGR